MYAVLGPRERGQKFSQRIIDEKLSSYRFVVRVSYLKRNHFNAKIAPAKLESVLSEHGGDFHPLEALPPNAYVTIGHTWTLNIVGAILRQAARQNGFGSPHKVAVPTQHRSFRKARASSANVKKNKKSRQPLETNGDSVPHEPPKEIEEYVPRAEMNNLSDMYRRPLKLSDVVRHVGLLPDRSTSVSMVTNHTDFALVPQPNGTDTPQLQSGTLSGDSLQLPRLFPGDSKAWDSARIFTPFDGTRQQEDFFDHVSLADLEDLDIEKWPHLETHELLSV